MFDITKIPYTKFEMTNALNEYVDNHEDEELNKIAVLLEDVIPKNITQKQMNINIAEYNGISVEELISSPNMEKLGEMYSASVVDEVYTQLINCGMSKLEGISLIYLSLIGVD